MSRFKNKENAKLFKLVKSSKKRWNYLKNFFFHGGEKRRNPHQLENFLFLSRKLRRNSLGSKKATSSEWQKSNFATGSRFGGRVCEDEWREIVQIVSLKQNQHVQQNKIFKIIQIKSFFFERKSAFELNTGRRWQPPAPDSAAVGICGRRERERFRTVHLK